MLDPHLSAEMRSRIFQDHESRAVGEARFYEEKARGGKRSLLGADCPELQLSLFDCLCDGHLYWIQGRAEGRRKVQWGDLTMWLETMQKLAEWEVIHVVFKGTGSERYMKRKLARLRRDLSDGMLERKLPFRILLPGPGYMQLDADDGTNSVSSTPMTISDCMKLLAEDLKPGKRAAAELKQKYEERGCRPGTFRKACKKLGVKRLRDGFGPGSKIELSLPD